jgi:hypothetical protein
MSQSLRSRPSGLLGITDTFVAYCLDRAVWLFARSVESAQEEAVTRLPKSAKATAETRARQRVLDQYLGVVVAEETTRFRSPVAKG